MTLFYIHVLYVVECRSVTLHWNIFILYLDFLLLGGCMQVTCLSHTGHMHVRSRAKFV